LAGGIIKHAIIPHTCPQEGGGVGTRRHKEHKKKKAHGLSGLRAFAAQKSAKATPRISCSTVSRAIEAVALAPALQK
jgi:hypothetical protein